MRTRPSRLYLPKLNPSPGTILEYILARFPHVDATAWHSRIRQGQVRLEDGTAVAPDTPYRHGTTVFYRREVPSEPVPMAEPVVIHRDENILIVDKPHGIPVTPSGEYVERSLLINLQRCTGFEDLTPVHRLDRDTAGLVMFSLRQDTRAKYHCLFSEARVEREYVAIGHAGKMPSRQWTVSNRLESGEPWFRQRIVEGAVNAVTNIELVDVRAGFGKFRLFPSTGKKHQLRVHMASIGCPIVGDPLYPAITQKADGDLSLQLLAVRLTFKDPLTGASHTFWSRKQLATFDDLVA